MKDLENVIPNPLKKNMTINQYYSYDYIKKYVTTFNNKSEDFKLSTSYYATTDFSGQENTAFLKSYNCTAIKNIPKQLYKFNSDFYIPAIGELSMAMEKVGYINNKLIEIGKKTIDLNKIFMSSTLYDEYTVWNFDMNYAKIGYTDIYEKNYILPFFKYEQKTDDLEDLESDKIKNDFSNFNLFTDLNGHNFSEYVFYNYENTDPPKYTSYKYPMDDKTFVGMPYFKNNNKDKLKFYIVIPSLKTNNPFYTNLKNVRPNYEDEMVQYDEDYKNEGLERLNLKYIECILYTFDNYLDIFEMNYRETFMMSSGNKNAEYVNNKNSIKFTFNNLGYFDSKYCIAICFELRYYKYGGSIYDVIFRKFYYYNNYNILIDFPYTNKIKFKYNQYFTQDRDVVNLKHNSEFISKNYVNLNNFKNNNNTFKFFLTDYPKSLGKNLLAYKNINLADSDRGTNRNLTRGNTRDNDGDNNTYTEETAALYNESLPDALPYDTRLEWNQIYKWNDFNAKCYSTQTNNSTLYINENTLLSQNQVDNYINAIDNYNDNYKDINDEEISEDDAPNVNSNPNTNQINFYNIYFPDFNTINGSDNINDLTNNYFHPIFNLTDTLSSSETRAYNATLPGAVKEGDTIIEQTQQEETEDETQLKYVKFNLLFNKNSKSYETNNNIVFDKYDSDYVSSNYISSNNMIYYIRTYLLSDESGSTKSCKEHGIFGRVYSGTTDPGISSISTIEYFNTPIQNYGTFNKNVILANDVVFNSYGAQQDIIFVKNNGTYNSVAFPIKKIKIINNTGEHINIWIEDELRRLCNKKVRLCIPFSKKFITYASVFLEGYYIKVNIELHNKYKFRDTQLSYSNIYVKDTNNVELYIDNI